MANLSPTRECQSSRLEELTAQATSRYSTKDYDAAAEFYAHATELQAEINGEMSTKNADLLYAYGRCLYQVAIKNSDVLGSGVAEGKPTGSYAKSLDKKPLPMAGDIRKNERDLAEEQITKLAEESEGEAKTQDSAEELSKPYFQFTGDENFDTSEYDADEGDAEGEEEGPEEEDDFANAYEVLDLARVLFQQRIHEVEHSSDRGKITTEPLARKLQGLLADTYDLQAEISLEGERFPDAAADLKAALELKMTLYPDESSIIAEAHYKLALALEFSSMMQHKGEMDNNREGLVNYRLREEAAMQMEAAIASCRVRIQKEQEKLRISLQINHDGTECETLAKDIKDVDGLVNEMEQRLTELRESPIATNNLLGSGTIDGTNPLVGMLGSMLGNSPAAQKAKIEEATKGANDLTSLVKKKRARAGSSPRSKSADHLQNNGKRRAITFEARGEGEGEASKRQHV